LISTFPQPLETIMSSILKSDFQESTLIDM